uniref:DNA primase n=1 Tax=Salipiger bermudensis TaxID=344736 RepID=UPI0035597CB0
MSLPPGFLDELRNRTSLVQVVGRKVMWDNRKSNQAKGDMWAPCPFHQEKSASFHVDDRKGFYYCFGCHAKGDAISFVRESENVEFMEAVEILAREAGMPMPARDPQAAKKADRREQLSEVMEQAVRFFRMQLRAGAATEARAYLDRRGLKEDVRDRFEIGFAPEGWQNLWDHLRGQGVAEDLILGAGLAKASDRGKAPYDVFRNRIMFPIRDARGRAIAFGGRAMDPRDNAKYLNSPETELFDKGRNLYNHAPAREAAGKGQPLIVAEGYMDVIALSEAGFGASVAPLGTAVTETQMQLLWRITDEPIVALDGDKAGLRAAYRVIDLALPLLQAGKTLRFALMPEGKDPDDLLRAEGAGAVSKVLEGAMPMVQLLWRRETEGKVFDSPERKAALDARLRDVLRQIQDPGLRRHYGDEIKELRFQLFRPQRPKRAFGGGGAGGPRRAWNAPAPPSASVKSSLLVAAGDTAENELREAVILAVLLSTPELIAEFEQGLEMLNCTDPVRASLRDVLLRNNADSAAALREEAEYRIGPEPLENLLAARHVAVVPCVRDRKSTRLNSSHEYASR